MHTVFVYGSLMRGYGNHVLLKDSSFISEATTEGLNLYSLGAFPAVKASDDRASVVHGEMYEVDDEALAALDRLEGHPTFYKRKTRKVFNINMNGWVDAYYYLFQHPVSRSSYIESGSWRDATKVQATTSRR